MDPVCGFLDKFGKSKKICMVSNVMPNRSPYEVCPDYFLFPQKYMGNNYYDLENFDEFAQALIGFFPKFNLKRDDLILLLDMAIWKRDAYLELLKLFSPQAVFFQGADHNIPLIMAARELCVKAIDIQRGNMLGNSLSYSHWEERPPRGSSLFPDAFFVWGEREKRAVEGAFNDAKGVVFGCPALEENSGEPANSNARLREFLNNFSAIVLVSLGGEPDLPAIVSEIAGGDFARERGVGFVVKREPAALASHVPAASNIFSDSAIDDASFASLAKHARLHITSHSENLYAADYLGLNTILIGDSWEYHFRDLAEAGRLYPIDSPEEFNEIFDRLTSFCHWPRLIDNSGGDAGPYVRGILDEAKGASHGQ